MFVLMVVGLNAWANCPQDDAYEDNDTYDEAVALNNASESNLFVCDTDEDWFLVSGTQGELLTIEANFKHDDGDIDLKLYDGSDFDSALASAVSVSDNETLSHMVETSGSYYLQVYYFSASSTGSNTYDLSISSGSAPDCPSDAAESNNSMAAAAELSMGSQSLHVCEFDVDWYRVSLDEAEKLDVTFEFDSTDGYVSATLYDEDEDSLGTASYVSDGEYHLDYLSLESQEVYLKVSLSSDGDDSYGVAYTMNTSKEQFAPCAEDSYSDNTDPDLAAELQVGSHSLVACTTEYFRFQAPADSGVTVTAAFDVEEGDLDLVLHRLTEDDIEYIDSSTSYDTPEEISYNTADAEELVVEVKLFSDAGNLGIEYDLTIDVGDPVVIEPSDDPVDEPSGEPTSEPSSEEDTDVEEESSGEEEEAEKAGGCSALPSQGSISVFTMLLALGLFRRIRRSGDKQD
ncbi:MAG: hypothetical protein VX278_01155 [Myxococcota bacterium]|nr:hypothetical protein [Myxococcota bacterium]